MDHAYLWAIAVANCQLVAFFHVYLPELPQNA